MIRLRVAIALASLMLLTAADRPSSDQPFKLAAVCARTGEMVSGGLKTCFYNCSGAPFQMTVQSWAVCPLTVPR